MVKHSKFIEKLLLLVPLDPLDLPEVLQLQFALGLHEGVLALLPHGMLQAASSDLSAVVLSSDPHFDHVAGLLSETRRRQQHFHLVLWVSKRLAGDLREV